MLRARRRLILTGTPLENSVLDLWSLFDFLVPGYLGTAAEFRERYETPLTRGEAPRDSSHACAQRVRPFFLRRTKEEVLPELPPKLEHATLCELTDEQREVYRADACSRAGATSFENSGKQGAGRDRYCDADHTAAPAPGLLPSRSPAARQGQAAGVARTLRET